MTALAAPFDVERADALSFDEVYAQHVAFVWRVLRSFGVPPALLEDAAQDVFVVVHRRFAGFRGPLDDHDVAVRDHAQGRGQASPSRERCRSCRPRDERMTADPFRETARAEAAVTVAAILDGMDDDKRIVFALVELEHTSVAEVARMLGINANTASSRLRLARGEFAAAVHRERRRTHE